MGWRNPPVPWSQLRSQLQGELLPGADGNDAPALTRKRQRPTGSSDLPPRRPSEPVVPYAELHCHSNFSFLDGANHPEELVAEAARLGLETLAITDHDGLYGVVRFSEAAREAGISTVFGAELHLTGSPRTGVADPSGEHLLVLAKDPQGYASLARALSLAQLAGEKGAPQYEGGIEALAAAADGRWQILTGCRKGSVNRALLDEGPTAARRALQRLIRAFGRSNVAIELTDHGDPLDSHRNDALVELADKEAVSVIASGNVHYARPADHRLAAVAAAIRARSNLDDMDGYLPVSGGAHLRSGAEQARRFYRYPGAVDAAAALGRELAFDLRLTAPRLPVTAPAGTTSMSHLRRLVIEGATAVYGPREAEQVAGAWRQIDHELQVIDQLGYPGYFLIVHEIVQFCAKQNILCQGRGSSANSAVCYVLGITKADPVKLGLLFERFLSPEREGPPDIDIDIESGRREEVIQHVYGQYGRHYAAQVANVITYRPKSAIRDVGKAFGHSQGQVDAWSRLVPSWGRLLRTPQIAGTEADGAEPDEDERELVAEAEQAGVPRQVLELASRLVGAPRHLGIHSGGMVLCDRPIIEVCPVEHARMEDRTVLQWDKDDCAAAGLVKFDLLGLGMLSAIHDTFDLIAEHYGRHVGLSSIPAEDPAVYDMLCAADAIGVFQVESRAQIATLPRLKPRCMYDLVVEVALIRPGPIQGGSVHPYLSRRDNPDETDRLLEQLHPKLRPSLARTLGVPLFQEQLMQMAVDAAGFTPAEADQLRRAMGSKRSAERMARLRERLYAGLAANGITGEDADRVHQQILAFADYGFPESHAASFALLVYASSWLKRWYPAAFLVGLLNNQPMGFYSRQTLVADARRQGPTGRLPVTVHRADVNISAADATLEPLFGSEPGTDVWAGAGADADAGAGAGAGSGSGSGSGAAQQDVDTDAGDPMAVRLGLAPIKNVGDELAKRIAAHAPYASIEELARRTDASEAALASLAAAGALSALEPSRRSALWRVGIAAQARADRLPGIASGIEAPTLPGMSEAELTTADLAATGVAPSSHPIEHLREQLTADGITSISQLRNVADGVQVRVAGVVTHRQQPATASGTVFINLEDETGMLNVVCPPGAWAHNRKVAVTSAALIVSGRIQQTHEVTSLPASRLTRLPLAAPITARDFR